MFWASAIVSSVLITGDSDHDSLILGLAGEFISPCERAANIKYCYMGNLIFLLSIL